MSIPNWLTEKDPNQRIIEVNLEMVTAPPARGVKEMVKEENPQEKAKEKHRPQAETLQGALVEPEEVHHRDTPQEVAEGKEEIPQEEGEPRHQNKLDKRGAHVSFT